MDGVFWTNDVGFVVDPQALPSHFPEAQEIEPVDFCNVLMSSGKLPSLKGASVASWLLARLFQLTREHLGFETNGRVCNDGGGYYLNFVAFTRDFKPAAFFNLHGHSSGVCLWGTSSAAFSSDVIVNALTEALLKNADDVMVCKVTTIDTDPPDLGRRRFGQPCVYGWDGTKYLGFQCSRE